MINNLLNIGASYFINQEPGQTRPTSNLPPPSQMPSTHGSRVVRDTVELSPAARQTLEQRNAARKEQQDILTDEILEKGFHVWAQEKYREKIEAEVRAEVLSSMGLDEEGYASLEADAQERIQKIIDEKVREKMRENLEGNFEEADNDISTRFLSI